MSALQRPSDFFDADEIARLRHISTWRSLGAVLHCWAVIIATWVLVGIWTNPLTVLVGIMIIGARQLGLFVLSHDGAHYALVRNRKLNDWISEWLLGRALTGEGIEGYRRYHLQHHAHTQQAEDPDLGLSRPFPISPQSFRRKVWRDLSGQTGWKQYGEMFKLALQGESRADAWRNMARRFGPNLLINLVFLAGFTLAGKWYLYFLLWWVPALTWNRFVTRLRNIGEHAAVPDDDDRLRNTRTIEASWWERAFIAPYGVHYHLEHHLVINAPWYNLERAHELLLAKGLRGQMEVKPSYKAMLEVAVPGHLATA